jgi:hypothetical protein
VPRFQFIAMAMRSILPDQVEHVITYNKGEMQ